MVLIRVPTNGKRFWKRVGQLHTSINVWQVEVRENVVDRVLSIEQVNCVQRAYNIGSRGPRSDG